MVSIILVYLNIQGYKTLLKILEQRSSLNGILIVLSENRRNENSSFFIWSPFMMKKAFELLGYSHSEPSFEETYKRIKTNKCITWYDKKDISCLRKSSSKTLLSHAVKIGDIDMVRLLLGQGLNVNEVNYQGESLLHLNLKTIIEKDFSIEHRLHDCNPLTDRGIKGLCHIKIYKLKLGINNYEFLQKKLTNIGKDLSTYIEINKLLLDHGIDINKQDNTGNTIAHYCVESALGALIDELFDGKAVDYNIENHGHKTPLLLAIDRGDFYAVAKLLEVTDITYFPAEYDEDFEIMLDSLKFGAGKKDSNLYESMKLFVHALEKIISKNLDFPNLKPSIEYYISSIKPFLKDSMPEIYQDTEKGQLSEAKKITKSDFNPINIINTLNKAYEEYKAVKEPIDIDLNSSDIIRISGEMGLD
jgi:ankyrin repeat protein